MILWSGGLEAGLRKFDAGVSGFKPAGILKIFVLFNCNVLVYKGITQVSTTFEDITIVNEIEYRN